MTAAKESWNPGSTRLPGSQNNRKKAERAIDEGISGSRRKAKAARSTEAITSARTTDGLAPAMSVYRSMPGITNQIARLFLIRANRVSQNTSAATIPTFIDRKSVV